MFATCSFVHLQPINWDVRFDLCCIRNAFRLYPGTLLSKKWRTAVVAIFWHSKYKRTKLFSSFDSESASSVNKIQLNHTNFVFINAKFINISEIKNFSYVKLRKFGFKKSLNIPKGLIKIRKSKTERQQNGQRTIGQTMHSKLQIEQHDPH
jgi:hypothetical protein